MNNWKTKNNKHFLKTICTLINIAANSAPRRDLLLNQGVFQPLLKVVDEALSDENNINEDDVKFGTFAISNLCKGTPAPQISFVKAAIPTLFNVLYCLNDEGIPSEEDREKNEKTLAAATSALCHLTASKETLDLVFSCEKALPTLLNLFT